LSAPATLASALRQRILDGELAPGAPLREQHLAAEFGLARHTVRAALRALAAEGLARAEANRGVRVLQLDRDELIAFGDLRIALEVEAARLALARNGGRLPEPVHAAARTLRSAAGGHFAGIADAHEALHAAIVAAAASPRIAAAHRALAGELRVFLVQLKPAWDVARLADEHDALLTAIERDGPDALRLHIEASTVVLTTGLKYDAQPAE
jgi:DNA-binding GntR family transcriptional regulator